MPDIFISYSRRDSEHALLLAERLRAAGANVWMDTAALAAAETWSAEIVNAIEHCTHFIVLLSEASVGSVNVTKEVALASESQKTIVPIELASCELNQAMKYALAGLQKVSLYDEEALARSLGKLGLSAGALTVPTPAPTQAGQVRIAVLPFEDQSPAHDNEWFSDGLTDELISTLNKLDALFVLDRKSSKIYRDAKMTVKHIASELNVHYIVTGAVRKAGDKIRIQATLIEARTGATLWDEKFNGTMEDIFEIQEKTAIDICEGLKLKLTPEEEQLLEEQLTNSHEAFELFMQARVKANVEGDFEEAARLAEEALAIDPQYLPALHLLSIQYSNIYRTTQFKNPHWLELEKQTIKRLMDIDPTSYFCYGPRANHYLNTGQGTLALEMAKKMVELQPKKWVSYAVLGFVASNVKDARTTLYAFEKTLEIDPSDVRHIYSMMTTALELGMPEKMHSIWNHAKPNFLTMIATYPTNSTLRTNFMTCADIAGDFEASLAVLDHYLSLPQLTPEEQYNIAGIFSRHGKIEEAINYLRLAIDGGWENFSEVDPEWFSGIKGTPEYDYVVNHVRTFQGNV